MFLYFVNALLAWEVYKLYFRRLLSTWSRMDTNQRKQNIAYQSEKMALFLLDLSLHLKVRNVVTSFASISRATTVIEWKFYSNA